jgi:hypothetical protein
LVNKAWLAVDWIETIDLCFGYMGVFFGVCLFVI